MRKLLFALVLLMVITAAYAADLGDLSGMLKDPAKPHVPQEVVVGSVQLPEPQPAKQAVKKEAIPETIVIPAKPVPKPKKEVPVEQEQDILLFAESLSQGLENPQIVLVDQDGVEHEAEIEKVSNPKTGKDTQLGNGKYDVILKLGADKKIILKDLEIAGKTTIKFYKIDDATFANSFAIDLSGLNYKRATYVGNASGSELWKCKNWSFALQECNGEWQLLQEILPGSQYLVSLSAEDPGFGEFGSAGSEEILSTTSVDYQNATQLNFTPTPNQYLLLGAGNLMGSNTKYVALGRVLLNTTTVLGEIEFTPRSTSAPGDYWPFLAQKVAYLNPAEQKLSVQFRSFTFGVITRLGRSRAIALSINSSDAIMSEFANNSMALISPTGAFHSIINTSYTPAQNMLLLILSTAELMPNSDTSSIIMMLLHNNTIRARSELSAQATSNAMPFGTHLIINASANVQQNFTLQAYSEAGANRYVRNARITIVPLDNAFFNSSEGEAKTTMTSPQNKTLLLFNLSEPSEMLIIGTAEINNSAAGNTFAAAHLYLDGALVGNMTKSAKKIDDLCTFITVFAANLSNGTHKLELKYNRYGSTGTVAIIRSRVSAIPLKSFAADRQPPTVLWTNISSSTPIKGDSMCFLAQVTDAKSAVKSVIARITLPNGTNTTLPLYDDLNCNSPENDSVYSNHIIVPSTGTYNWTIVNATDALGNSGNTPVGRTFVGIPSAIETFGMIPPNLSRYNNGTIITVALINTSNNVYATQNLPKNTNTYMYFNWTLNISGEVLGSNVTIEHKYSETGPTVDLQIRNGTTWQNLCYLTVSTSDTTDVCNLNGFMNGNASVLNNLQLRTNAATGGQARTQSVDWVYIRAETQPAGSISKCGTITSSRILAKNITSNSTCITFGADNIELDCGNYSIFYDATGNGGEGILAAARKNVTVKNCLVRDINASGNFGVGILFDSTNSSAITNTTIFTNGTYSNHGILMQNNAHYNAVQNCTVRAWGNESFNTGIQLRNTSARTNVSNNVISTNGTYTNHGILLINLSFGNTVSNNTITANGLTVTNNGIVLFEGSSNNTIKDNKVSTSGESDSYGMHLQGSGGNNISNNAIFTRGISGSNQGIRIESSSGNMLAGNNISTNGTSYNHGILMFNGATDSLVENNTVLASGNASFNVGIYAVTNTPRTNISKNTVLSMGDNYSIGILAENGSDVQKISDNSVTTAGKGTDNYGIEIATNITGTIIENNTVVTNGINNNHGILLISALKDIQVKNNTVSTQGTGGFNVGIYLSSSANNVTISWNSVRTNGTATNHGLLLDNFAENNTVTDNAVVSGGTSISNYGIYLFTSPAGNIVSGNKVNTTGAGAGIGIRVEATAARNAIANNTIQTSGSGEANYGIYATNTISNNTFANNTIRTNGTVNNHGIFIENTANDNNITENTIHTAGTGANNIGIVLLTSVSRTDIIRNTVNATGTDSNKGILLQGSASNNTIRNNTIYSSGSANSNFGIYLYSFSSENNISGNSINTNGTNSNTGIRIESGADKNTISNNTITTNGNESSNYGIHALITVAGNILGGNIISTNGTDSNHGILFQSTVTGSAVENNTISAGGTAGNNIGIYLLFAVTGNTIANNTIRTNGTFVNHGILLQSSVGNNTVRANTIVTGGSATSNVGIYLITNASENNVIGNFVNTTGGGGGDAIRLSSDADLNLVANNTLRTNGTGGANNGIFLSTFSEYNSVSANNVVTGGTSYNHGILLQEFSAMNNFTNNNISAGGTFDNTGIYMQNSSSNIFSVHNITATGTDSHAIRIIDSNHTIFNQTIMFDPAEWISAHSNTFANLTNTTFEMSDGSINLPFSVELNGTIDVKKASLNISFNNTHLNSITVPFFNTTGVILLRNVNESDPEVGVDFEDDGTYDSCPAETCTILENNQTLEFARFNVSHFTSYTIITRARLSVLNLSPYNGEKFLINGIVNITANATVTGARIIDTIIANITKPDGSTIVVPLLNQSKDIYNATISGSDIYLRGTYNITFIANDTGSRSASAKVPFIRSSLGIIDIIDVNGNFVDANITIIANNSGILDLDVSISSPELANGPHNMVISNHNPSSPYGMFRQGYETSENLFLSTTDSAIDLSLLNFSSISFTKKAYPGHTLLKCAHFNYSSQSCMDLCPGEPNCSIQEEGLWVKAADMSDDSNYHFELLNATDPGFAEYNASQRIDEINTTSLTPVTAIQLNTTPASAIDQYIIFGYAELAGYNYDDKFGALLSLNDTNEIGRLNYTAKSTRTSKPPGYYPQFYTQKLVNLNTNNNNLSVQFFSIAGATTTFIRRATAIVTRVNNSDALTNDSGDTFASLTTTGTDIRITNLSFTPSVTQNLLVLASAEYMPVSITNKYINISLKINNTESGNAYTIAAAANDVMMFGTHKMIFNATAGVQQNFTIVTRVDGTLQVRRARIIVMPVAEFYHNASENSSYTTSTTPQNKTCLNFNLTTSTDVLVLGSAELSLNSFKVSDQIGAQLVLDNLAIGNTTLNFRTGVSLLTSMAVGATNLSAGSHTACLAFRRDAGTATQRIQRGRITILPIIVEAGRADLFINSSYINFNDTNPNELQNITINATVFNLGTAAAPNVLVNFWDGINCSGYYIGNYTISPVLLGGNNITINMTYNSRIGNRTISVCIDPYGNIQESNRSNNNASRTLNVKSTTLYFGSLNGSNLTLDNALNITNYDFGFNNSGNIYFFYSGSAFNFTTLQALGRNSTGGATTNDFWDADYNLNSTFFNDSVRRLWANWSNGTPITTRTFDVYNNTIQFVPIINSTNNSIFVTGILWDTEGDTNGQYDTTDNETLVFVGTINQTYASIFGLPFDYEIRIATLLRSLKGTLNKTAYIVELQ